MEKLNSGFSYTKTGRKCEPLVEASLKIYLNETAEVNTKNIHHLVKALRVAIREELTDKQQTYLLERYVEGLKIDHIALRHGVNKSTVSRTIHRAQKRLHDVLRYVNERTLH